MQELREKNLVLESNSKEITRLNESLLEALAEVIDMRDPYVLGHSKHVTRYAVMIAQRLRLPAERVELIRKASLLHDIGKLGIPDRILLKPSRLSSEEFEVMKAHTTLGSGLLETSNGLSNLIPIVRHHHEWYDGGGYPDGLKGKNIPLEARIVSLADAVEAMASDRPYRRALAPDEILLEIQRSAGTQFDPDIVKVFVEAVGPRADELIINSGRKYLEERESNPVWMEARRNLGIEGCLKS
ncbi:MAG: HD-GYP domain-containing protein [Anaerolineales bacterium]